MPERGIDRNDLVLGIPVDPLLSLTLCPVKPGAIMLRIVKSHMFPFKTYEIYRVGNFRQRWWCRAHRYSDWDINLSISS